MKKHAALLLLCLLALPLHAGTLSSCGAHAFEKKYPKLDWSRLSLVSMSTFAGNVLMNICVGVDRQSNKIQRLVIRDGDLNINVQEPLSSFANFRTMLSQANLPSGAGLIVKKGPLIALKVSGTAPTYSSEIRFHRALGKSSAVDSRKFVFRTKVNAAADVEASYGGEFFDGLTIQLQSFPSLMIKNFNLQDSTRRSNRDLPTKDFPAVTTLGGAI